MRSSKLVIVSPSYIVWFQKNKYGLKWGGNGKCNFAICKSKVAPTSRTFYCN